MRREARGRAFEIRLDRRSAEELALELRRLARERGIAVEINVKPFRSIT